MNVTAPRDALDKAEELASRLAGEMRERWRLGERPLAEEFLARHLELANEAEAAIDVVYEEFCLRVQVGECDAEESVLGRFPQWQTQLASMLECHRLFAATGGPRFPAVGDSVGGFRLVSLLGKGRQGRVYLAEETELGDRKVVLKITPREGAEHLALAQLQHTHIVPLYAARDVGDLRFLCMPYFGGVTLARLLEDLAVISLSDRHGQHILLALDKCSRHAPRDEPRAPHTVREPTHDGPIRKLIAASGYVPVMCWIGACLAEALHEAHRRGLVHLDVKPTNVLIADDGQPMLLDFHVSRSPMIPDDQPASPCGGTPAYMPPEQHAAVGAAKAGLPLAAAVDGRADVYSLGAVLYEALAGTAPTADSPPLVEVNALVGIGLSDMIARCLASEPERRYPSSAELAADLRRHLSDRPLCGVPNRSWSERWQKLRRRRPTMVRSITLVAGMAAALALVVASGIWHVRDRREQAQQALLTGEAQLHEQRYADAARTFRDGLSQLEGLPIGQELADRLREQHSLAIREQADQQLHQLAERVRAAFGMEGSPAELRALQSACHAVWLRRERMLETLGADESSGVKTDLLEVAICLADLVFRADAHRDEAAARLSALRILGDAELLCGASAVLDYQRRTYETSNASEHKRSVTKGDVPNPTAWEHAALGRALLRCGDLEPAAHHLAAAVRLDPAGRWSNFYFGLCAYRRQRYEDAVGAFSVAIGAAPDSAVCYYNRALAYVALGRTDRALADLDGALALDGHLAAAWLNRGMLHYQRQEYGAATADLHQARHHGAPLPLVQSNLELVQRSASEAAAAHIDAAQASAQRSPMPFSLRP